MSTSPTDRLEQQIAFLVEIDKLKQVFRQSLVLDASRRENDAEHSWHLALMALILVEHAAEPVDLLRVVQMVLIHDIVEIDAGDTFAYDVAAMATQHERELKAAERIFNLLPPPQNREIRALWDEFEEKQTPEARFATSLDRLAGILANLYTEGKSWRSHGVTADRVLARNAHIADGAPALWEWTKDKLEQAIAQGHIPRDAPAQRF